MQPLPPPVVTSPAPAELPAFPWPPPQATSRAPLQRAHLLRDGATLGDVARRLERALAQAGHVERSYHAVPGGFALATRLEQIDAEGRPRPEPGRWSAALPTRPVFSLGDYFKALFTAPRGDYRVIVFIVTDQAVTTTTTPATQAQATIWIGGGADRLPPAVAQRPFGPDHAGSALVYQFRKTGHGAPAIANPADAPSAAVQLQRTGILPALAR